MEGVHRHGKMMFVNDVDLSVRSQHNRMGKDHAKRNEIIVSLALYNSDDDS